MEAFLIIGSAIFGAYENFGLCQSVEAQWEQNWSGALPSHGCVKAAEVVVSSGHVIISDATQATIRLDFAGPQQ